MSVEVHGLDALEGETAFAFFVVRMREAVPRDKLVDMLRYLAPLIPDPDTFIDELPEDLEQLVRILAMPWSPPEAGHAVDAQRRLIETAGSHGVEAAWFFQTGTSLPDEGGEADEDDDDDEEDAASEDTRVGTLRGRARTNPERAGTTDESWVGETSWSRDSSWSSGEVGAGDTKTTPIELVDMTGDRDADFDDEDDDPEMTLEQRSLAPKEEEDEDVPEADDDGDEEDEEDEDDASWSHGAPPQVTKPRFVVDGYPAILQELDWEDFGIAFKLRGEMLAGEGTLLFGFHTLWLAPYGGRFRNAAVTIDRKHHAAHLWVDRFAVPCSAGEQVHHLLWILSKLDEIVPVVHARFAGATMAQKYAGLMGDASEPVVLGGNPLLAIYASDGEQGVDRWIAQQTDWSADEVAQMLRELAIEVVTTDEESECEELGEEVDGVFDDDADKGNEHEDDARAEEVDDEDDEGEDDDDDDDEGDEDDEDENDDDDDDDEAEGNEDEDRGRQITSYAGELLTARAVAGKLDPRAAEQLLPVLEAPERVDDRHRAVVKIFGALRYRPAVPAMIKLLEETTATAATDFVAATAAALGAIGDPTAIDVLARVVAAPGTHNDEPRPIAAEALASCLAAMPEPRHVDEAVLAELLTTIRERNDGELNAETQLAYGRIVHQLPADRRAEARRRLAESDSARDDAIATLARHAALLLASPTAPVDLPPRDMQPLLHESLTSLDYDHDDTVRKLRIALSVAEIVPQLVAADDLIWLTRFAEPDIRARAHALLVKLGKPLEPAPVFDVRTARELAEAALVRAIGEPHIVGRAALIAEAGRRDLDEAKQAILRACHDVISRARQGGENLLDPDARVLAAAMPILRESPGDGEIAELLSRMERHSNYHISKFVDADEEVVDDDDEDMN